MKRLLHAALMFNLGTFVVACADEDMERPQPRASSEQQPPGTQTAGNTTPNAGTTTQTPGSTTQTQTPQTPTQPTPQTPAVTYAAFVQPLYMKACLGAGCHNAANPADGIPLDTQANAKMYFSQSIQSIDSKKMPTSARAPLTADEIAKLKQWRAANFP